MSNVPHWPFPADSPLDIARHVARSYRETLRGIAPDVADRQDTLMVIQFGQSWILPGVEHYEDDYPVTADIAGVIVARPEWMIRKWATQQHPDFPGRTLLPRHGWEGRRRTFLAGAVRAAARIVDRDVTLVA